MGIPFAPLVSLLLLGTAPAVSALGCDPSAAASSCTQRGSSTRAHFVQHEQQSFAKHWVSRVRGGGSKVKADGKAEMKEKGGGFGKDKAAQDDVKVALVGNFPNRQATLIVLLVRSQRALTLMLSNHSRRAAAVS